MHSDWFNGMEILQGRWQHGEKVEYCYPSGLENTLFKWDIYVPLVTKWVKPRETDPNKCGGFSMSILHPLTLVQIYSSDQAVFCNTL
jgi:hypothetical protein